VSSFVRRRLFIAVAGCLCCASVLAGQRLEGALFPSPDLRIEGRWAAVRPGGRVDPALGSLIVGQTPPTELRLAIPSSFLNKPVRIFMLLPSVTEGYSGTRGFEVEWTTQGVFRPGSLRPGERVVLFEGVASAQVVKDYVAYTLRVDGNYLLGPLRFDPVYEIEER